MNSTLGYVECFGATHYCRRCKMSNHMGKNATIESPELFRNVTNYQKDVEIMNKVDRIKQTGIKEECVFNRVPSFHLTSNFVVDPLHDVAEGIASYDMAVILKYFIYEAKFFTLASLNKNIELLNYGPDSDCKPVSLSEGSIKAGNIKLTGGEMQNFVRYFGLLCHGLNIPSNNSYFKLYIFLRKISCIINSDVINEDLIVRLRCIVKNHHNLYITLSKSHLKPKYHFLTHYVGIMREIGPVTQTNTMLFERKHRDGKRVSNVSSSRVHITQTIAIKHQLQLANKWVSDDCSNKLEYGKEYGDMTKLRMLYDVFQDDNVYKLTNFVNIFGTIYRKSFVIVIDKTDTLLNFGLIEDIIIENNNVVFFHFELLNTEFFDTKYQAFKIKKTKKYKLINSNALKHYLPLAFIALGNENFFVTLKNYII